MNFVADEHVDGAVIRRLRADGHDVLTIAQNSPSISDEEILRTAAESDRVVITTDKDFGELVYRLKQAHGGVILLRLAGMDSDARAQLLSEVVRTHRSELPGSFTVVDATSVRIRRPPATDSASKGLSP